MTNGEKLEQVFPDGICPFSKIWLDYEYKEPLTKVNQDLTKNKSEIPTSSTTKNDLAVDAVSRQAINGYIDYILSHGMGKKKSFDFIKKFVTNLTSITPQEPILDKIRAEIDKQEKWLAQAGYNAYNLDIAFSSIKLVLAEVRERNDC
jgi:hypothetical protein